MDRPFRAEKPQRHNPLRRDGEVVRNPAEHLPGVTVAKILVTYGLPTGYWTPAEAAVGS